jgi:hypothetical protein
MRRPPGAVEKLVGMEPGRGNRGYGLTMYWGNTPSPSPWEGFNREVI